MTDDEGVDEHAEETDKDDELKERIHLTREQTENLRQAMATFQQAVASQVKAPTVALPESFFQDIAGISAIREVQRAIADRMIQPVLDVQKQISDAVTRNILKNVAPALLDNSRITAQFTKNIDFGGLATSLDAVRKISSAFAEQQAALLKNLGPAIAAMVDRFYPPNLRGIEKLLMKEVVEVVMTDGIPLYGVPGTTTAEALIRAESFAERQVILGRDWRTISADCRVAVEGFSSTSIAVYVPFALAALNALDAGHAEAAQALAGSLVDTIVNGYLGDDRYRFTPNRAGTRTTDAYNEFTIREYVAFAPIWRTYQQFEPAKGDPVPATFSRHATAHAVSAEQYHQQNAVQGVMFACSLLYRLDEEAAERESTG